MACVTLLAIATMMAVMVVNILSKRDGEQGNKMGFQCFQVVSSEKTDDVTNWRRISEVLDTLCLVVYLIVTCGLIIWVVIAANS